jgi:hypothetical protein
MREMVERSLQTDLRDRPGTRRSRGLRVLEPWRPEGAPGGRRGRARNDRLAQMQSAQHHLALVSFDEAQLVRSPATVVMRQLLEAWRSVERELAAAPEGGPERSQIQAHAATLRLLYQGLFAQVRARQREPGETPG